MPVSNAGDDRGGRHRADAWDCAQKAHTRVLLGDLFYTIFVPADSFMQSRELLTQIMNHLIGNVGKI